MVVDVCLAVSSKYLSRPSAVLYRQAFNNKLYMLFRWTPILMLLKGIFMLLDRKNNQLF